LTVLELPWGKPTVEERQFAAWKDNDVNRGGLWLRLSTLQLAFFRKILNVNAGKRATLAQIKAHPWYKKTFKDGEIDGVFYWPILACFLPCLAAILFVF